jgi:3-oxoacyl-[acyl-carrier-protein] synthase II
MYIDGIGVVFTRGRGVQSFEEALQQGWRPPDQKSSPAPVYRVEKETLTDKSVLRKSRRADRFSKMALLAAWDAAHDSSLDLEAQSDSLGVILATGFGPHVTTFGFLDEIINYGDGNVSPTIFSHSVHNAAASYIALALNSRGPTLTLTRYAFSFQEALMLAQCWIDQGRCQNVLVGCADVCGTAMEYICSKKLRIAGDGKIKPFDFSTSPQAVPGEGSIFFMLTAEKLSGSYCEIAGIDIYKDKFKTTGGLMIVEADGMTGDETNYLDSIDSDAAVAGYSPLFGSMMTGSGFNCAAASLMLKNQIKYASPVTGNPHRVNICSATGPAELNEICCIKYNCDNKRAVVKLKS